jgi:hypothetical protein
MTHFRPSCRNHPAERHVAAVPLTRLPSFVDEHGNVQITGRSKEIINRGGRKFFPRG